MRLKTFVLGVFLFVQYFGFAQNKMSLSSFYEMIQKANPQLKIAEIQYSLGEIDALRARGFLDPKITSELNEKNFDDKRYYRLFNAELKVPTAYGINFIGGYQNTLGTYINPQEKTPKNGLFQIGIEANILQGLWVSNARMAKREAENTAEMYRQISQNTKNAFYYSAGYHYLEWEEYQAYIDLYEAVVQLSEKYFNDTKETFILGEKPAIDTLESHIAWQDWQAQLEGVFIEENKINQKLKYYLFEEAEPNLFNHNGELTQIDTSLNANIATLPQIREKEEKLSAYQWQERLKREKLKPKLKLKYVSLVSDKPTGNYAFDFNNYKFGFNFSYDLFNRKAKADVRENQAKQELLKWEINLKKREIETKLEATLNNIEKLETQHQHWQEIAKGNKQLLDGELEKFEFGESSLFLITKRQEKWIKTKKKALSVYYKWQKEKLNYLYLSNQILATFGIE